MWALSTGREVGLMYLCTQPFPFWKHLQYKPTEKIIMLITATEVPIGKNILTLKGSTNYMHMS